MLLFPIPIQIRFIFALLEQNSRERESERVARGDEDRAFIVFVYSVSARNRERAGAEREMT